MKVAVVVAATVLALAAVPVAAQDLERGEQVFKKCVACHAVGENAKNKVGPVLNEVFGRTAGTLADYKYSKAMIAAGEGGLVWTHETLFEYLHKPNEMVKGTKMAFAGIKSDEEINNLLAYLQTFSPDYVPAEGGDDDDEGEEGEEGGGK
ncbi:c-type cytochrome [Devosia sp.]|uniref:c-type cytochrome n=1 Tax=Devosia sp. TaxID=1871048 RepID=UPI002F195E50